MKTAALAAKMGEVLTSTQAESNAWKKRMLTAGIRGLMWPDDWDLLSEDEKQQRLDKVIAVASDGDKMNFVVDHKKL